jgi:hypothetical protein
MTGVREVERVVEEFSKRVVWRMQRNLMGQGLEGEKCGCGKENWAPGLSPAGCLLGEREDMKCGGPNSFFCHADFAGYSLRKMKVKVQMKMKMKAKMATTDLACRDETWIWKAQVSTVEYCRWDEVKEV